MTESAKLAAISRRMERVATASIYNTEAGSRKLYSCYANSFSHLRFSNATTKRRDASREAVGQAAVKLAAARLRTRGWAVSVEIPARH